LRSLGPYDHLKHCYRYCFADVQRNVATLRHAVTPEVYRAMFRLSSFEAHDLEATLNIIRAGGWKAKAWLKDKIEGNKFALPALYFQKSLIPADIWRACPTTTNSNEQAHQNINQDGTNLSVLGGIMHGRDYNDCMEASININNLYGIHT
ncbi:hypothetical protein SCLCIDRAFT_119086, partial [Scleroderma citrinum Foug A]